MSIVSEATQILIGLRDGDRSGVGRLMELVYDQMRSLASHVRRRGSLSALQPIELVHEAFVKLVRQENADWRSRSHFYAVAATAMRQILVNDARQRLSVSGIQPGPIEFYVLKEIPPKDVTRKPTSFR